MSETERKFGASFEEIRQFARDPYSYGHKEREELASRGPIIVIPLLTEHDKNSNADTGYTVNEILEKIEEPIISELALFLKTKEKPTSRARLTVYESLVRRGRDGQENTEEAIRVLETLRNDENPFIRGDIDKAIILIRRNAENRQRNQGGFLPFLR